MASNFESILEILLAPAQRLENGMIAVRDQRNVDTAVGVQLEVLGRIVGESPSGLSDDIYRRHIRARIATNNSTGTREELIKIARLILNDDIARVVLRQQQPATIQVTVADAAAAADVLNVLVAFLTEAAPNGVRVIVTASDAPPETTLTFNGTAAQGFSSSNSPTGGTFASARTREDL